MSGRAPRKLDKKRPYAEVYGLPGAAFQQDGILFTAGGLEAQVDDLTPIVDQEPVPMTAEEEEDPNIGPAIVQGGEWVDPAKAREAAEAAQIDEIDALIATGTSVTQPKKEEQNTAGAKDIDTMHHMQLKQELAIYAEPWPGSVEEARTLLRKLRGQYKAA